MPTARQDSGPGTPLRPARRVSAETLFQLSFCPRRLHLMEFRRDLAAPPDAVALEMRERGREHERRVRERFSGLRGPIHRDGVTMEAAAAETLRLLRETRAPLYQPAFLSEDGSRSGVPDFVYWDDDGPVIHDAKLAQRLEGKPYIALALTHYARLLEESTGLSAARLEITNGRGEVVEVPRVPNDAYDPLVAKARAMLESGREPDLLLSHSTCSACPFYDHCWDAAERDGRVEILPSVKPSHVPLLHSRGIRTVRDLAGRESASLRIKGIGNSGALMIQEARAFETNGPVWLRPPALPAGRPLVWFDLEGEEEHETWGRAVYLWGLAVDDGEATPETETLLSDGTERGDEDAWRRFVARAAEIFERHPAAVWVHYHHYEVQQVKTYLERYGAPDGLGDRLLGAMLDLHTRVLMPALRLPIRSYSIKFVAPWMGFTWRNPASGSHWSMQQYRRAKACADPAERDRILREIAEYNEDDLLAMRAVWRWIEAHRPPPAA